MSGSGDNGARVTPAFSGEFTATHWSVVLAATEQERPEAAEALETLCRTYWYPLYAYVRRTGHGAEDAEDLVQGFFLHLLRRKILKSVQREGGRFRSFLLATFKHFLSDERDKVRAKKRGGECQFVSWDHDKAEQQFLREPVDIESPDRWFDRRWTLVLLERAMERLCQECMANGNDQRFTQLKGFVSGEKGLPSYAEVATQLGLSQCALKSVIFRLRRRYHELVREEVSQTVADPREVEEELRHLLAVFGGG